MMMMRLSRKIRPRFSVHSVIFVVYADEWIFNFELTHLHLWTEAETLSLCVICLEYGAVVWVSFVRVQTT